MGIAIKGRGFDHLAGRFESTVSEAVDGWAVDESEEFLAPRLRTEVRAETARSIITRNNSPDVGFSQSVNPYRAASMDARTAARPSHAYLNLSPGLDFETKLFAKTNAPQRCCWSCRSRVTCRSRLRWASTPMRTSRSSASSS